MDCLCCELHLVILIKDVCVAQQCTMRKAKMIPSAPIFPLSLSN